LSERVAMLERRLAELGQENSDVRGRDAAL
jgi:hypothetical protein